MIIRKEKLLAAALKSGFVTWCGYYGADWMRKEHNSIVEHSSIVELSGVCPDQDTVFGSHSN